MFKPVSKFAGEKNIGFRRQAVSQFPKMFRTDVGVAVNLGSINI